MKSIVLFQIGEQRYAFDLAYSRGIENHMNIMKIPNAPRNISGVINLRGEIFPVYSLRSKFNLPPIEPTEESRLIIGMTNGMMVAYEVDRVIDIEDIQDSEAVPAPVLVKNEETAYVDSIAFCKAGLTVLINTEGVLGKKEKEQLEQMLEQMKKK